MDQRTRKKANANLRALKKKKYPGRIVITGMDVTGRYMVMIYVIMGRSASSRSRRFVLDGNGDVRTIPTDPSKIVNSELVIYRALSQCHRVHVVTNGAQTDAIIETLQQKSVFLSSEEVSVMVNNALANWTYEPDADNFTTRIGAVCYETEDKAIAEFSVIQKSLPNSPEDNCCDHHGYQFVLEAGLGHYVTTYDDDGNPLPQFKGKPRPLLIKGDIEEVAHNMWEMLDPDNRVAQVVRFVELGTGITSTKIHNRF